MPDRTTVPCGTNAAYWRHIRRHETVCPACTTAHAQYQRARSGVDTRHLRIRRRAEARLAAEYPDRYEQLYAEEDAIDRMERP